MTRPRSIAELRDVSQPIEVRSRRNAEHWTAGLYLRHLSPYVTWVLLATPISANGVTVLMILTGWVTAASLLIPGITGVALALVLGQLQMLIDCCDGEVARWRKTSSPLGSFLDAVGHYSTEALIAIALGLRAAFWPISAPEDYLWMMLGFALALVIVLNKALNDMVRVARSQAGLEKTIDAETAAPRGGLLALARRIVKFFPFHRILHSVELTMVAFATVLVGLIAGIPDIDRWLVIVLLPVACVILLGHFVMIIASRRLSA